jgi:hypothetical protein
MSTPQEARATPADLIERAARGLRAARDYSPRMARDHEFIFRGLVPEGLVALDALQAEMAALRQERDRLRDALTFYASYRRGGRTARAALSDTADRPPA